jgi:iron complex outermembrane receptor protein
VYNAIGNYGYINAGNDVVTKGLETNINSYFLRNFNFAAGYTYTDASRLYDKTAPVLPLTARHSLMLDMMYYDHKWKVGAESYYIGQQYLSDGSTRPDYWLLGFLIARNIKNFVFTLNFENLLNVKQTTYEAIYTGSREHPEFKELWAPLDGLVANASVRINF